MNTTIYYLAQFNHEQTKYLDSKIWQKPSALQMEKTMTN